VYEVSRKNTMLSMRNNGYLPLGGLHVDSSHIAKLLKKVILFIYFRPNITRNLTTLRTIIGTRLEYP